MIILLNGSVRTMRTVRYAGAAMSTPAPDETSYIVLGLLEQIEPATPYDLKQLAQLSTVNFWTRPAHPALHRVRAPRRGAGCSSEQREQSGRRRRIYRLTDARARGARRVARGRRPRSATSCATRPRSSCSSVPTRRRSPPSQLPAAPALARDLRERSRAPSGPRWPMVALALRARDRPRARVHPLLVLAGRRRGAPGPQRNRSSSSGRSSAARAGAVLGR